MCARSLSLCLHNIKIGAQTCSNDSSRLANRHAGIALTSSGFSVHGFIRICQANDHGAMVTTRVLLRRRTVRNSYQQQRFP
jgi:hypothetical protein